MATNFIQDGNILENTVSGSVSAGDPVVVNSMFGVYLNDYTSGETGQVAVTGVWKLNKSTSQVVAAGQDVYWYSSTGHIETGATGAAIRAGVAWAAAATAATTCHVKLNAPNNGAVKAL